MASSSGITELRDYELGFWQNRHIARGELSRNPGTPVFRYSGKAGSAGFTDPFLRTSILPVAGWAPPAELPLTRTYARARAGGWYRIYIAPPAQPPIKVTLR